MKITFSNNVSKVNRSLKPCLIIYSVSFCKAMHSWTVILFITLAPSETDKLNNSNNIHQ